MMVFIRTTILLVFCYATTLLLAHPIDFPDGDFLHIDDLFNRVNELENKEEYRLSDKIWPTHYELKMRPIFTKVAPGGPYFTFDGEVTITLHATDAEQSEITLHAKNLLIYNDWSVHDTNGEEVERGTIYSYQNETHKVTFPLVNPLLPNVDYFLKIVFKGEMDDSMRGFYRSHYIEEKKIRWIGSTHFQTTDARQAFPCFDEPKFKTTFSIKITRPSDFQITVGNTRATSVEIGSNLFEDTFATTPVMSSYLVAFVVSDFQGIQTADRHYGVYGRPDANGQFRYAFDVGQNLLDEMGSWIDYPFNRVPEMEKIDMIAIPDFNFGGI